MLFLIRMHHYTRHSLLYVLPYDPKSELVQETASALRTHLGLHTYSDGNRILPIRTVRRFLTRETDLIKRIKKSGVRGKINLDLREITDLAANELGYTRQLVTTTSRHPLKSEVPSGLYGNNYYNTCYYWVRQ